jgi:hypothetical protein
VSSVDAPGGQSVESHTRCTLQVAGAFLNHMIVLVPSSRCRRAVARALAAAAGAALVSLAVSGCVTAFRPSHSLIPGPSGAVAAATISQHRMAVLAGSRTAKAIYLIDLANGEIQKSFGVTKEATGVAAATPDGPLLVTVGGENRGKGFGALEQWTLNGTKSRVIAMPSEARGITRVNDGLAYVLIGAGDARAAVPVIVPSLTKKKTIPLEAGSKTLQQCEIGASPYLLYSSGSQGTIVVREIDTGIVVRSTVVADSPICIQGRQQVFALSHSFAAASVVMLSLPTLLQQGLIPASNDAIALYETEDHHLVALNATSRLSNLEVFADDVLKPAAVSK